jgi:hypothetical protein
MAINLCRAAAASKRWKSPAQTRSHSDGYSIARSFRTSGHARRRTSASYSGDRQKNQAWRMRILYCGTVFHRDVPRNCAQLSPRAIAAQTYFRTRRFPIKGRGEIHHRSNLHRHQGRLVGFGIVQGHMAAFLADDVKSNLFQLSHQFSCTRLPEVVVGGPPGVALAVAGARLGAPRGP